MSNEELLILAIEGLTRSVLEIRDQLIRMNEEGIVVLSGDISNEN